MNLILLGSENEFSIMIFLFWEFHHKFYLTKYKNDSYNAIPIPIINQTALKKE